MAFVYSFYRHHPPPPSFHISCLFLHFWSSTSAEREKKIYRVYTKSNGVFFCHFGESQANKYKYTIRVYIELAWTVSALCFFICCSAFCSCLTNLESIHTVYNIISYFLPFCFSLSVCVWASSLNCKGQHNWQNTPFYIFFALLPFLFSRSFICFLALSRCIFLWILLILIFVWLNFKNIRMPDCCRVWSGLLPIGELLLFSDEHPLFYVWIRFVSHEKYKHGNIARNYCVDHSKYK